METHHLFFIVATLFSLLPTLKSDLSADRAALVAFRTAAGGRSLLWNISDPNPCNWAGVTCGSGRVTELHFPAMGFSGQIPVGVFGNLTGLQTLSLRLNTLTGPIPPDLSAATQLRNLYLQGNLFSGPIPDFLFTFLNLVHLNLASNKFSGEISPDFNKLTRLSTIQLENNDLNGSIPELDSLPSLVLFNVSNNHLTGQIPHKLSVMPASAFSGNSLCGDPFAPCSGRRNRRKLSCGAIVGIVIGSVVLSLLIVAAFLLCLCRRNRNERVVSKELPPTRNQAEMEIPIHKSNSKSSVGSGVLIKNESVRKSLISFGDFELEFDLEDLLRASAEVLGKGTFGTTYKALMERGPPAMAVKRLKDVTVPEKVFREKMAAIGALNHENLVPLLAYYYTADEKLLVYDYLPMGSLSELLHGNRGGGAGRTPLNWETRAAIAVGAARGIEYIHSRNSTFSHGNIKSSNILLTASYEARVSDSGLSQLVESTSSPTRVVGYRAPEVTNPHKISQKADVYSFGVLLLELMTGRCPLHSRDDDDGVDLPRWVQSVVQEEWTSEIFDLELLRYQNVEDEMMRLLTLAVECVGLNPDGRPSMAEVAWQVEEIYGSSL